ncbi:MAG: aldo/keto reductase [Hyphomicrobiales bacterium]
MMRRVTLPGGETVPAVGLGTWRMGDSKAARSAEAAVVRAALDRGMTLIDTAEMYGEGGAEESVGEGLAGRRKDAFIVSKVYPHNAGRKDAIAACERSLRRLRVDTIDLYLLHWRGSVPLAQTVEAFEELKAKGRIRYWGVSNFDVSDMEELLAVANGGNCAANQVLYHLGSRGIEYDLVPWSQRHGIPIMAYSPLGVGRILSDPALAGVAKRHGVEPATVAVAWSIRSGIVISIPKTAKIDRLAGLAAGGDLVLTAEDLATLDKAFPPPRQKQPLASS